MFEVYFNQDAMLERLVGESDTGKLIFAEGAPIKARIQADETFVIQTDGKYVTSSTFIMTTTPIKEGDKIIYDGSEGFVMNVQPVVDIMGGLTHYEARL